MRKLFLFFVLSFAVVPLTAAGETVGGGYPITSTATAGDTVGGGVPAATDQDDVSLAEWFWSLFELDEAADDDSN